MPASAGSGAQERRFASAQAFAACQVRAIFLNLLLQRFKTKSREEIRQMIAELTPLHETRAGKELLEEGIERGIEQGIERGAANLIRKMVSKGRSIAEISDLTDLSIEEITRFLELDGE